MLGGTGVCVIEDSILPLYWCSSWLNVFLCIFIPVMAFLCLYSPSVVRCSDTKDTEVFVFWQLFICHVFVSFLFFISHSSIHPELEVIEALSGSVRGSWQLLTFLLFSSPFLKLFSQDALLNHKLCNHSSKLLQSSVLLLSFLVWSNSTSHFKPLWNIYWTHCLCSFLSSRWLKCAAMGIRWVWSQKPALIWWLSSSVPLIRHHDTAFRASWDEASRTPWGREEHKLHRDITGTIITDYYCLSCSCYSLRWWLTVFSSFWRPLMTLLKSRWNGTPAQVFFSENKVKHLPRKAESLLGDLSCYSAIMAKLFKIK